MIEVEYPSVKIMCHASNHKNVKLFLVFSIVSCIPIGSAGFESDNKNKATWKLDIKRAPYVGSYHVYRAGEFLSSSHDKTGERLCTGILVDLNTAITAGRCVIVDEFNPHYRLLPLGVYHPYFIMGVSYYPDESQKTFQKREVTKLFIHPKAEYAKPWPVKDRFDIGAIKWKKDIELHNPVEIVPLLPSLHKGVRRTMFESIISTGFCWIPSFGELGLGPGNDHKIDGFPFQADLHYATYRVMTIETCCESYYSDQNTRNDCKKRLGNASGYYCSASWTGHSSLAWGDAGSPIVCQYRDGKYVVGMHTTGEVLHKTARKWPPEPLIRAYIMTPGFWITDEYMYPFIQSISSMPQPMSRGQQLTPEIGMVPIIVLLALNPRR